MPKHSCRLYNSVDCDELDQARSKVALSSARVLDDKNKRRWLGRKRLAQINAKGMRLETNASGTYKTSFEFGGMRPGKPLSKRIDPCQRSWWRSTRNKNRARRLDAPHIRTHDMWKILLIWKCLPVAISVITATKHILLANRQSTHVRILFGHAIWIETREREWENEREREKRDIIPWDGQDGLFP